MSQAEFEAVESAPVRARFHLERTGDTIRLVTRTLVMTIMRGMRPGNPPNNSVNGDWDLWRPTLVKRRDNSERYIVRHGAAEYAFRNVADQLFAGSYHGGEKAMSLPQFYLNGDLAEIPDRATIDAENFSIKQHTRLKWPSGDKLRIHSTYTMSPFGYRFAAKARGDLQAFTSQFGLCPASPDFIEVVEPTPIADVSDPIYAGRAPLGNGIRFVQRNPKTGARITTELGRAWAGSLPMMTPSVVAFTPESGAKLYPGWHREQPLQIPGFTMKFSRRFD